MSKMFQVYGLGQALIPVLPPPIAFQSAPTANQNNYEYGQIAYVPPHSPTSFFIFAGGTEGWIDITTGGSSGIFTINSNSPNLSGNYVLASANGNITIAQTANTSTFTLAGPYGPTSYTAHAVLLGEGGGDIGSVDPTATAGAVLQNNVGADPTYSTASYPSTASGSGTVLQANGTNWVPTTATYPSTILNNEILYASANNVITPLAAVANAALTSGSTGTPVMTSMAMQGGLLVGAASGPPVLAQIQPGTGISVVNGTNTITISATGGGGGLAFSPVTSSTVAMAANTLYWMNNGGSQVTATVPSTIAAGQIVQVAGNSAGGFIIAQNAGQSINYLGTSTTTGTGGSITAVDVAAQLTLLCTVANTNFLVISAMGNVTIV